MMADIGTVMWREWKELLATQGSLRGGLLFLIILLCVFGIVFPVQEGSGWVTSQLPLINATWLPFFFINGIVVDSFAGERERKTLETLLASRLSDRAILFGKIGAAISYGWGLVLITTFLALIAINVAYGHGQLLLYSPMVGLGIIMLVCSGQDSRQVVAYWFRCGLRLFVRPINN